MRTKVGNPMSAMTVIGFVAASMFLNPVSQAAVTRVGNGDDGTDIEGMERVTSGKIIEARDRAVEKMRKLGVEGVAGLGALLPELERAPIFIGKRDVPANLEEDQGTFHTDFRGLVFARTFAEPHAATRMFPVAEKLDLDQLEALLTHEALHRALPVSVRENESKVAALTLSLTAPNPTHDRIVAAAIKYIPTKDRQANLLAIRSKNNAAILPKGVEQDQDSEDEDEVAETAVDAPSHVAGVIKRRYPIPEDASIRKPSTFGYTYTYFNPKSDVSLGRVKSMHTIESSLYAFGSDENPIGVGVRLSLINQEDKSNLGPLGLSGRMRLWSNRGYDVGGWVQVSLNTLSANDLRNSPYGRDVTSLGLSMKREIDFVYLENTLGYTLKSEARQKVGGSEYRHEFGGVANVNFRVGGRYKNWKLGGFGEVIVADYYKLISPNADAQDSGRFQIVSVGPEFMYDAGSMSIRLFGRMIANSSSDASYDYLGNILSEGSGQGSVGFTLSVNL